MKFLIPLFLLLSVSLFACTNNKEAEQDKDMQQLYIQSITEENQVLRDINDNLRHQVVDLSENLSRSRFVAEVCSQRYAYLTNISINMSTKVPVSDILVRSNQVVLNIPEAREGIIAASRSMAPLLTENDIVLEQAPQSVADIHVGDIIVYEYDNTRIIHRVARIDHDQEGWFVIARGDNNPREDPYKVRFADIRGVVVAIIY